MKCEWCGKEFPHKKGRFCGTCQRPKDQGGVMNNIEYGDKLIRLGKLMKKENTKLSVLVGAALECGLIYTYGLTPHPTASVEMDCDKEAP